MKASPNKVKWSFCLLCFSDKVYVAQEDKCYNVLKNNVAILKKINVTHFLLISLLLFEILIQKVLYTYWLVCLLEIQVSCHTLVIHLVWMIHLKHVITITVGFYKKKNWKLNIFIPTLFQELYSGLSYTCPWSGRSKPGNSGEYSPYWLSLSAILLRTFQLIDYELILW